MNEFISNLNFKPAFSNHYFYLLSFKKKHGYKIELICLHKYAKIGMLLYFVNWNWSKIVCKCLDWLFDNNFKYTGDLW